MARPRRRRFSPREWLGSTALTSPARLAVLVFASVIGLFTALLSLPAASADGQRMPFVDALFTATSAVCVTGLTTVDTGTAWSPFGQVVILAGIKVGGLGIMTLAALLGLAVSRRLGLTQRLLTANESRATGLGDVKSLLGAAVVISAVVETILALMLFPRFLAHGLEPLYAGWHSVFYSVSAFNNAGFSPQGGLGPYISDGWVLIPIALGVMIGALGFPVYLALIRNWRRPREWPLHTKLTLVTSGILTVVSAVLLGIFEWTNPRSLGSSGTAESTLNLFFMSVNQRSGGFSTLDIGATHEHTWLLEDVLMFIGGGSGGTAGGIRVTTLAVLLLAVWAEVRGRRDVEAFGKRIGTEVVRVAVSVMLFSLIIVIVGTGVILVQTAGMPGYTMDRVLYEVVSAFATCGLSVGISGGADTPDSVHYTLTALMFIGRVGSMTLAAALALNKQRRVIRYPSERPIIG